MNWKGFGRKWSWPHWGTVFDIYLEGLRKAMKALSRGNQCLGGDLNQASPEYKAKCRKPRLTTLGIHCADHTTPSIRGHLVGT
jgi:hypothetical protein